MSYALSSPPPPDCNHSDKGVCSKCFLYRSFDISGSKVRGSTEPVQTPSQPVSTNTPEPTKPTQPRPQAPLVLSLDAPLTASLAVAGQFRFLPVSTLDSPHAESPSTSTACPSVDTSQLSRQESGGTKKADVENSTPSPQEGSMTYTSFEELGIKHEAKIHSKDNESQERSESFDTDGVLGSLERWQPSPALPKAPSLLLRLFESDLCDISITLQYLHSAKESGVISYLGNKLFKLPSDDVDFYVPQLVNLLLTRSSVAESIRPYLVARCKTSAYFALICCWLLEAYNHDRTTGVLTNGFTTEGESFRQLILADFRQDRADLLRRGSLNGSGFFPSYSGHVRSSSDAAIASHLSISDLSAYPTAMRRVESSLSTLRYLTPRTLPHGRAFHNDCTCFDDETSEPKGSCECGADRLRAEQDFIRALTGIGDRLRMARNKKEKSHRLISELHLLNSHLPARVWIPLHDQPHIVLRIPPEGGCVLNSKDKAPYCIYVEVLMVDDVTIAKIPPRLSESDAELHERLSALTKGTSPPVGGEREGQEDASSCPNRNPSVPVIECNEVSVAVDQQWWQEERGTARGEDSLSQRSMDSWNSTEERTISPADIRRRLKEWVKKPKRQMRHTPDDPSAHAMSEPWDDKRERLRVSSPYGRLPGWQLLPVIVKTGDDLRQELLAYQLLKLLERIWTEECVPLVLRPYKILVLSHDSGMIEPIVNACSLHQIKRNQSALLAEEGRTETPSLLAHFIDCFGPQHSEGFMRAQQKLVRSAAAYSLASYFLQVKDRHNGNILIDSDGHLIHIDFGFILSASPRNLGFETSPFKLTTEVIDVMGGTQSDLFGWYKILMLQGLLAARKHIDRIMNVVEIMIHGSPLACFRGGSACLKAMRDRFHLTYTESQLQQLVDQMVEASRDSLTTRLYDNYQYYSNGIL